MCGGRLWVAVGECWLLVVWRRKVWGDWFFVVCDSFFFCVWTLCWLSCFCVSSRGRVVEVCGSVQSGRECRFVVFHYVHVSRVTVCLQCAVE